jgi:hypothetical protein
MMFDAATHQSTATEEELQREAYNAAFYELGLTWYWDANTYRQLMNPTAWSDPVRIYLETEQAHLLKVYDAAFLSEAIEVAKRGWYESMRRDGGSSPLKVDWAEIHRVQIGV